mgnify:CR=1 FL=1
MKNIFQLFIAAVVAVLSLAGCEQVGNDTVAPSIEIVAVSTTDSSLTFAVSTTNATECAYMLYDGDIITAETGLNEGAEIDASGVVEVKNLKSETTYYVVAAARNAAGEVLSNTLAMKTTKQSGNNNDDDDSAGIVLNSVTPVIGSNVPRIFLDQALFALERITLLTPSSSVSCCAPTNTFPL